MYQALYRKWRPQVFADVVGQDHITTTLMNEISEGRHSHAYLFTGSRGTGKTTCAKIFAKAVNCEHPINGDPCNECETCKGIDSGAIMDVIEIDAASNNGVDNIRDIRDEANFTPVNGKYRVYIIDEVHMLSTGAFNALLKTLEEPPAHVKFVLATTEVHKLPATILSRCQRFDFKRITPEDIAARISYVAEQEGLTLEADAAMLIARLADGALRDALSILDQCIGRSRHVTLDVVNATVGLAGKEYLFSLGTSILNKDSAMALEQINTLHNNSCDMERLCNELTNHFRNLMICKAVKEPRDLIVCSEGELREYKEIADSYSMDFILEILNVLGDTLSNLRKGLNRRVEMEMAIIKLCTSDTVALKAGATPAVASPIVIAAPVVESAPIVEPAPAATPIVEEVPVIEEPSVVEEVPIVEEETPIVEETPVIEEAPAVEEPPVVEPAPAPVAEVSPTALQEGEIPTNLWNELIREVVNTDKALIGTMNSAIAYKVGDSLVIKTDNVLFSRFLPQETHNSAIYDATFAVFGEYLKPRLLRDGEVLESAAPAVEDEPIIPPVVVEESTLEVEEIPLPEEEPIVEEIPLPEEPPIVEEIPLPEEAPEEDIPFEYSPKEEPEVEEDPLDAFLDKLDGQIDFSLFIED